MRDRSHRRRLEREKDRRPVGEGERLSPLEMVLVGANREVEEQ